MENTRRFYRKLGVYVNRKVFVSLYPSLCLDNSKVIQKLLGPADGKGRNYYISAPIEGFL